MNTNNGRKTTAWGNEEIQETELDSNSYRGTRGEGLRNGAAIDQRTDRTNGKEIGEQSQLGSLLESETVGSISQPLAGGILREIQETQTAYLSYLQAHHDRLAKRLEENEQKQAELYESMKRLEDEVLKHIAAQAAKESATEDEDNHQSS